VKIAVNGAIFKPLFYWTQPLDVPVVCQGSITVCHTMSCNKAASKVTELFLGTKSDSAMSKFKWWKTPENPQVVDQIDLFGGGKVLLSFIIHIPSYPISGHLIRQ
jgi:hypothetical protein